MQFRPAFVAVLTVAAALGVAPAMAGPAVNLIVNGDFETTSATSPTQVTATNVTGWVSNPPSNPNSGYNFIYFAGTGDGTPTPLVLPALYPGATNSSGADSIKFWGPKNGANNGFTNASPTGGNFIGADPAFSQGPIYQTVNGLTIGTDYLLTFYWAAAQQYGYDGATTESWAVTFGTQTYSTLTVNNANHGFVPWMKETVTFRAKTTSQVLSFMPGGGPVGLPPFALLDGVSLYAVPEPATWAALLGSVLGAGALVRRRS